MKELAVILWRTCFFNLVSYLLKGYLHCKTIAFQNVSSEAQIQKIFVLWKSYFPFSRYSSFCISNHPMIYQICDVMMSISTSGTVHFWIYLLNHNLLSHQTQPVDRYKKAQYLSEIFWTIWNTRAKLPVVFNVVTCSNYSIKNYVKLPVCFFVCLFFERVNKRELKMVNIKC